MAPVDLKKNKDALLNAHKDVSDPKSATNWYGGLFYEGKDKRFGFLEMSIVQCGRGGRLVCSVPV